MTFYTNRPQTPNTISSLKTSLERKKSKVLKRLDKVIRQLVGAINHASLNRTLKFELGIELDFLGREMIGIIVVNELFDEDRHTYMLELMKIYEKIDLPCLVLSYMELYSHSYHLDSIIFFDCLKANHTERVKRGIMLETKFQSEKVM
ncbi:MAG TPA: hypothetical protein VGI71_14300 [Scandinavium sp.]